MGELLSYSLAASLYAAGGWAVCRIAFSRHVRPGFARSVIMTVCILSLLLPLAVPAVGEMVGKWHAHVPAPGALEGMLLPVIDAVAAGEPSPWLKAAIWLYAAGVAVVVAAVCGEVVRLVRLGRGSRMAEGFRLVLTGREVAPCSFMGRMWMSEIDSRRDDGLIVAHELAHLRRRHWIDLVVMQGVCALMWYNPAAWLLRRELYRVHEYEADADVLAAGADRRAYQNLLIEKAVGVRLESVANSLNHSNILKRITMMNQKPSRSVRRMAAALLLPVFGLTALALSRPEVATTLSAVASADKVTKSPVEVQAVKGAKLPQFPGGEDQMLQFLVTHVRYPQEAMQKNEQGYVVVRFMVGTDGKISSPEIVKGVSPSLDAEALRVVGEMPVWEPGIGEDGQPVALSYVLPVNFKLQAAKCDVRAAGEDDAKLTVVGQAQEGIYVNGVKNDLPVYVNGKLYSGNPNAIKPEAVKDITVVKPSDTNPDGGVYITLK